MAHFTLLHKFARPLQDALCHNERHKIAGENFANLALRLDADAPLDSLGNAVGCAIRFYHSGSRS